MDYKSILTERFGYKEFEADLTIEDIQDMDEESRQILNKYFEGMDVSEYAYREFSVAELHTMYGFNVIASILAISNLKQDYDFFSDLYKSGIK